MPSGFESKETTQKKFLRLNQLLDSQINTPTLDGIGLNIKGAPYHGETKLQAEPVERSVRGKIGLFDPTTKKFLGYKNG